MVLRYATCKRIELRISSKKMYLKIKCRTSRPWDETVIVRRAHCVLERSYFATLSAPVIPG
jgi:hypothetical protein